MRGAAEGSSDKEDVYKRQLDHCVHKAGEGYEDAPVFLRLEFLPNEVEHRLQFQQELCIRDSGIQIHDNIINIGIS